MGLVMKWAPLLLTVIVGTMKAELNRGSIFLHEHGMLLREHGLLYLDTSNVYLSVFVNLAIPVFNLEVPTVCSNRLIKGIIKADKNVRTIANEVIERHDQLLSIDNSHGKKKRSVAAALGIGLGVFNLIFTGVAEYKVSKHIREVEQQFIDFKSKQSYINEKFVNVLEKTVSVVDHNLRQLSVNVQNVDCTLAKFLQEQAYQERVDQWYKKLDQLFYYINKGTLSGPLNSFILEPKDLLKILNDHPELHKTSFAKNIMLFYQSTTATYMQSDISADNRFLSLHLVLETPLLFDSNSFRLYKIEKVPLMINDTCITIETSKFVYSKKEDFSIRELDYRSCTIGSLISICDDLSPQNKNESSCIMKSNCTLSTSACEPNQFIYHYTGILFSGQGSLSFIKKNPDHNENKIIKRKFSKFGLAWVSWEEAEYVQYGGLRVSGPTHVTNLVTVMYPRNQSADWWTILSTSNFKTQHDTQEIMEDLNDLKHVIDSTEQHKHTSSMVKLVVFANSIAIFAIIGTFMVLHCSKDTWLKCFQFLCKCCASENELVVVSEPDIKHVVHAEVDESVKIPVVTTSDVVVLN